MKLKILPVLALSVLSWIVVGLFVVGALSLCGCATTMRGRALQAGQVAKEVVDTGAKTVEKYLDAKIDECEEFAVPGGRDLLEECLGPVASKPDEIDAIFEAVRSAQLALYLALVDTESNPGGVQAAMADLWAAVSRAAALIKTVQGED